MDFPQPDRVIRDLGGDFINHFVAAVDGAREDFEQLKAWQPSWSANFSDRFTANFFHERIWDRLIRAVADDRLIHIHDAEPVRQLQSGTAYMLRIKRHRSGDKISAYPTSGSLAFWGNMGITMDGLETVSLAIGYYWDSELREAGDAVLSFRDGKDNPVWAVKLQRDTATVTGIRWEPIAPGLGELDLSSFAGETGEDVGS